MRNVVEPKCDFYSGHCNFDLLSSKIINDNQNNIRFIQAGFLGNMVVAMTYRLDAHWIYLQVLYSWLIRDIQKENPF